MYVYRTGLIPVFCILFSLLPVSLCAQKLDPRVYQADIDLGIQLYQYERSSIKALEFLDSMPYSPHKTTYLTYLEDGVFTHVFWEEKENSDEQKEIWITFEVKTHYPFAFRNTEILEFDQIPNEKDYKFIRAQKRFNMAKLLINPLQPYYQSGDKLIPVFLEENGKIVAYVRRIPRFGMPRLGDGFKVLFDELLLIDDVQPLTFATYSMANVSEQGDLIVELSKQDCKKNSISPLIVRDVLVYQQVFDWHRVVFHCDENLIVYNAVNDSWMIEPKQKYGSKFNQSKFE